jgi:hypothetical protein
VLVAVGLAAIAFVGCGSTVVTAPPTAPPTATGQAAAPSVSSAPSTSSTPSPSASPSVAALPPPGASPTAPSSSEPWPLAAIALPSAVTTAPSLQPGYQCHPCHFLAEDQLLGVAPAPGGLIAVGVQQPPAQAVAFSSSDGSTWSPLAGFDAASGTTAVAAVANAGRTVIVGLDASGATSWATTGRGWTQAPVQPALLVPYSAGAMTAVTASGHEFVAGGYRDDPLHDRASAAVWRSADGLAWHPDASPTFAGGRIWGIAARAGTIVAVGTDGDPNYGPAAAWRWTAATGWRRARIEPDPGGAMRAVTATTAGFVAVGLDGHDGGALSWTSPDGLAWTAAPDQPAFHYFELPVRMQSVTVGPGGLLAGGWRSDTGKGSAVTWTSVDGRTWVGPTWEDSFSGGQITGLAAVEGAVAAVGRTGYPDWNQAAIWVLPPP